MLLLFIFQIWEILILGGIILVSWKIWEQVKTFIDVKIVARIYRQRDDKLQGYVLPIRENVSPRNFDLLSKIETQSMKGIAVFAEAGGGKSKLLSWICWQYSDPVEVSKYKTLEESHEYDKKCRIKIVRKWRPLEPVKVFAFNYHKFQRGKGDFEGLNFDYLDIANHLPDIFNPEYKEFLIKTFSTIFVSFFTTKGIMASMLDEIFRKIYEIKQPRNWEEFVSNAEKVSKSSSGLESDVATIVALKVNALKVGRVSEITFNFDMSLILDFAYLPSDLSKNFYSEFYANIIYDKAEKESVAGRPHSIAIALDEAHRTLQYSSHSVVATILKEGRKHIRAWISTQNFSDVDIGARHFQHLQGKTHNHMDVNAISTLEALHAETLRQLNEKEFAWINDGASLTIPVFRLDTTRLEIFRIEHPQVYENRVEEKKKEQPSNQNTQNVVEENTSKYDKVKTEKAILDVVEASPTGLFVSQVLEKIGHRDRNDSNRGTAFRLIKKMAKDGKIRIKDYISADKREHKLVFSKDNPQRAETQVHKRLRDDTKTLLDENKIPYTEGEFNQSWDFVTEVNLEAESSLKRSLSEWNDKILKSEKLVITILCNEEDRERYSYLPCVEAGKTKLVLLYELLEILKEVKKND